ncbi:MAG: alpha-L-fucosidase [Smithella sp.]
MRNRKWFEKPGLSVMYQIELRPGWQWDRNFVEFNKSMSDEKGNINFNGPYCKVKEWVDLSRDIGLDYHVFEIKWHDGICWWNTKTTKWTADRDYAEEFAELSRSSQIPFMYYYSAVFDHNPQFDSIQPAREILPSFIGNNKDYQKYLIKHFDEIMNQYRPDGMWFDWWWADGSTETTYKYFQEKYPETVMTFNMSNLMPGSYRKIQITSGEAHRYDGKWVVIRKEASGGFPVFTSSRKWANAFRWIFDHQWEEIRWKLSGRRQWFLPAAARFASVQLQ